MAEYGSSTRPDTSSKDTAVTPVYLRPGDTGNSLDAACFAERKSDRIGGAIEAIKAAYVALTTSEKQEVRFEPKLDISEVVCGNNKVALGKFPLPNGETLGILKTIGLPRKSSNPHLVSITRDDKDRGLWLEISFKNPDNTIKTTHVLLTKEEKVTGEEAILCSYSSTQQAMHNGYKEAKEKGHYKFDEPGLDISEVICGINKVALSKFPLPNGETLGIVKTIGLPVKSSNPRLVSIREDIEKGGLWLEISCENPTATVSVLLSMTNKGKAAVLEYQCDKKETPTQQAMRDGYKEAKEKGRYKFDEPLDISEVISGNYNCARTSFPLPNGQTLGIVKTIGLPVKSSNPRLVSIREDIEKGGLWLEISCENPTATVSMLLSMTNKGKAAVIEYKSDKKETSTQQAMHNGYKEAKEKGHYKFDEPGLDISEVIRSDNVAQKSFPLPNGETLGIVKTIGLPQDSSNPRLVSITRDDENRGLWLEISCENPTATVSVLLSMTNKGKAAVLEYECDKKETPTQQAMQHGYKEAKEKGHYKFDEPLDISEILGKTNLARVSFPLPNGETLGILKTIGLPRKSSNPHLISITRDDKDRGLWLEISFKNPDNTIKTIHVLLTKEEKVTGEEAILCSYSSTQQAMHNGYKEAKEKGHYKFDEPLDISEVISGKYNYARIKFPLPNGETLGIQKSIGLPQDSSNLRLVAITYNQKENSFQLIIRVLDKYGMPLEEKVILSGDKGVTGREAIKSCERSDCTPLPEAFLERAQEGLQTAQRLGQRAVQKKDSTKLLNSVKGECFEQLMGVLLAGRYPDEQILPQYCLDVDKQRGYYGMRVDFRVGDKFYEIKWGKATENIRETYQKHKAKVGDKEYVVLCLCQNPELDEHDITYTLFSSYTEGDHPLAKELKDAMAKLAELVRLAEEEKDKERCADYVRTLDIISEYLYATFHRVATDPETIVYGEERIEALREALTYLTRTIAEDAQQNLIEYTTRHRSTLEAYFHLDEKLFRRLLPLKQLHDEEPERYDLGYCFTAYVTDEDGERRLQPRATFTSKQDFGLLWTLFVAETSDGNIIDDLPYSLEILGEQNEHGWFTNPTFTVGFKDEKFSFSRHTISNLDELGQLAKQHGLFLSQDDLVAAREILDEHQADVLARDK